MFIEGKPVLHIVDAAAAFQAARFLEDSSAKTTWDTLRCCWIDTYLGPADYITHDAGKNFSSTEFRQQARSMAINIIEVPVEAHNSVGKIERYHLPLRRAFTIIRSELGEKINKNIILQMAIKAINDTAGPNGIIPTLLVFGAYPRISDYSPPSPSVSQRAEAVRKATKEVQRIYAGRLVKDALGMRNGPNTEPTLRLPIQSDVRVWRENIGWTGPFKLLDITGETCRIDMPHGPVNYRTTCVKPYFTDEGEQDLDVLKKPEEVTKFCDDQNNDPDIESSLENEQPVIKRSRGRPKGSRNRVYFYRDDENHDTRPVDEFNSIATHPTTFITEKEKADKELSLQLRNQGIITTAGEPFEASDKQEINDLINEGVFRFETYDESKHAEFRIFKSRMVHEIKGKATNAPYEKSRLVIQGYQDDGKRIILTQSPTIQRASQRLIVALAPTLIKSGCNLWLRDITQAYVQSETKLNRLILAQLPKQIKHLYPENTIMVVLKPLYGIAEAGTHWWATYFKHHKERLTMNTSTYDPCLLITTRADNFGIVGMQTDDTLTLCNDKFSIVEENELMKARFAAKPKQKLDPNSQMIFNGCTLTREGDAVILRQKEQAKKIKLITDSPDSKRMYVEQRARGAYIASICQPEATFDLSIAAQHQSPSQEEISTLNKRLSWQLKQIERGLKYVPLDLSTAKLFVFVDSSFANNKNFSSQIGFEIIIANENMKDDIFTITGNIIHWSSTKSKRVTRSVLAAEIYGMVAGVDMAIAIGTTLEMITTQLSIPTIPIIVCTDSFSLYECLVKLGSTKEKRLIIDIMALRQSYERRELFEIRWINGQDNPADSMTKSSPNKALETFIDTNKLQIRIEGWVKR